MAAGVINIIGIDLAASAKRDTGICIISGKLANVSIMHDDEEILALVRQCSGSNIIGIDAPLSLPPGRKSIDDLGPAHFRSCDLALRKRGIRFFPITLGPMRMLTKRGMELKRKLMQENAQTKVYEVYPGATFDISGIPRKNKRRILAWARGFVRLPQRPYGQDELDSVAAAITMMLHVSGKSEALGGDGENRIIVPEKPHSSPRALVKR
jgi:predicted nuclease with RNAse H fold